MVERGSFHNLPEVVKLELCTNPLLSYIDPQAFRSVRTAPMHFGTAHRPPPHPANSTSVYCFFCINLPQPPSSPQ